jgi:hypothetical protein
VTGSGRPARFAVALGAHAAIAVALVVAGRNLPGPVVHVWPVTIRWTGGSAAPALVLGVVRSAALTVTTLAIALLAAAATGELHRTTWSAALATRPLLGLGLRAAGLGLAGSLAVGPVTIGPVAGAAPRPAPPVMRVAPPTTERGPAPPVMRVAPPPSPTPAPPDAAPARPGPSPQAASAAPPALAPTAGVWVIEPGDHLWKVAGTTLRRATGRVPTDPEVLHYVERLVAANRSVLRVPGDADLVYPGQRFTLPPV